MALFVYRFRVKTPVLEIQLEVEVGVPVSIDDHAGGGIIDIECDDSRAPDLMDAMAERGYEFVEGSPPASADERFRADNDILGPVEHRAQDQLVHSVAEDGFEEYTYVGNKVTAIIVWTDVGKTKKIREESFTYIGNSVTQIVTKQYDAAGSLITGETMTEVFSYTGQTVDDITRSMS